MSTLEYPSIAAISSTDNQFDSLVPSSILFLSWKDPDIAKPKLPKLELRTKFTSGYRSSLLVESLRTSIEKELRLPSIDNGFVVTILIVDPIPPEGNELLVDL